MGLRRAVGLLAFVVPACGSTSDQTGNDDAAPAGSWELLIAGDWSLAGGDEQWPCVKLVLDEDVFVGAIRPIAPPGTHHTVLALGDDIGGAECAGGAMSMIYASGVGTNALTMPEGVGLRLPAGQALELELHLFNTGDAPISGTSGVEIVRVPPGDVANEAEIYLPGPFDFTIPAGGELTWSGTCTLTAPQTIFALFPHMHQLGTHLTTTVGSGGVDTVIHDAPYSFAEQAFLPLTPIALAAGDTLTTTCTWNNTTASPVVWGNSSTEEMCFSIVYRYPLVPGNVFCIE